MQATLHLKELARQVRGGTCELLRTAPEAWLTWAPPGTSNHILWHAGHALWVQDVLCVAPLVGAGELPAGWAETFGMNCRPVATTRDWPGREELLALLTAQLERMYELFDADASAADGEARLARIGPDPEGEWDLVRGILHGLHDEARHQGEMLLLGKLCREGAIERWPQA